MNENMNASSTTINIILGMLFLVFMLAYYSASALPITDYTYSLMLDACSQNTWQSPEIAFATLTTTTLAILAAVIYPFKNNISKLKPKRTHNGASVAAAGFLTVWLSLFFSLFFIPCNSALSGPSATSSARAGHALIGLMHEYVLIYAAVHALLMLCVFCGGVVFINLKLRKAVLP